MTKKVYLSSVVKEDTGGLITCGIYSKLKTAKKELLDMFVCPQDIAKVKRNMQLLKKHTDSEDAVYYMYTKYFDGENMLELYVFEFNLDEYMEIKHFWEDEKYSAVGKVIDCLGGGRYRMEIGNENTNWIKERFRQIGQEIQNLKKVKRDSK